MLEKDGQKINHDDTEDDELPPLPIEDPHPQKVIQDRIIEGVVGKILAEFQSGLIVICHCG